MADVNFIWPADATLPDVEVVAARPAALALDPSAVTPTVRRPIPVMKVNGIVTPGLLRFSAYSNGFFSTDTWTAHIGIDTNEKGNLSAPFWAGQDDIELDLMVSMDGAAPKRVMLGRSDRVQLDLEQQMVRISGRDYTGLLVDKKTSEKFRNMVASDVIVDLAQKVGLETKVQATTTQVGQYYDSEHVVMNGNQQSELSYWSLMVYLAQHEGMNLWVDGKTVFLQPPSSPTDNPLKVAYRYSSATSPTPRASQPHIVLERGLTLVRDISVTVISWNHENKKAVKAVATSQKSPRPPHGGPVSTGTYIPVQNYRFNIPGLTKDQAMQEAQSRLSDLSKHERRIALENWPGDLTTTPRNWVTLTGTKTDFDQSYLIERIERTISMQQGFIMSVWAKNSSPANSVVI